MRPFEPLVTLKDWVDQLLHAVWGASLVFLFSINVPIWLSVVITIGFAIGREVVYQHPGTCGEGCRTDLLGWLAGVLPVTLWLCLK